MHFMCDKTIIVYSRSWLLCNSFLNNDHDSFKMFDNLYFETRAMFTFIDREHFIKSTS